MGKPAAGETHALLPITNSNGLVQKEDSKQIPVDNDRFINISRKYRNTVVEVNVSKDTGYSDI